MLNFTKIYAYCLCVVDNIQYAMMHQCSQIMCKSHFIDKIDNINLPNNSIKHKIL